MRVRRTYVLSRTARLGTYVDYQDNLPLLDVQAFAVHTSCRGAPHLSSAENDDMDGCGAQNEDVPVLEKDGLLLCGSQEVGPAGSTFRRSSGCQQQSFTSLRVSCVSVYLFLSILSGPRDDPKLSKRTCVTSISMSVTTCWRSSTPSWTRVLRGCACAR